MIKESLGFTGSRYGMSDKQQSSILTLLSRLNFITEFHHGDSIGADEEFHRLSTMFDGKKVIHPPILNKYRAFCNGDVILMPRPYLTRNKDIIKMSDIVIATPKQSKEVSNSETWTNIKYAIRLKKRVYIIKPNGQIELI